MRITLALLAATFLAAVGLVQARAAESVTVDFFYKTLEPQGDWIDAADYGYVWHPRDVAEDWRPYRDGSWAFTDAGWTWVSSEEEPYGSIVYHYGRWVRLDKVGWSWVPDTEWGAAWVSWRRSEKHVGWAPLPPEAHFDRTTGIREWSDSYYDVGPTQYNFVETRHFGSPHLRTVVLAPRENVTIIRETRNITNITVQNDVIYAGGPEYDVIVRESAEPVRRLRLERRTDIVYDEDRARGGDYRTRVEGDSLRVFAPTVQIGADFAPTRITRRVEKVEVNRGWRDAGPQAETLRAELHKSAPRAPAELPAQPRFERTAARAAAPATAAPASPNPAVPPADATPATPAARMAKERAGTATPPATAKQDPATSEKPVATTEKPMTPPTATASEKTAAPDAVGKPAPAATEKPAATTEKPPTSPTATTSEKPASPEAVKSADAPAAPGKKPGAKAVRPGKGTSETTPDAAPAKTTDATAPAKSADPDATLPKTKGRPERKKTDAADGPGAPDAPTPDNMPKPGRVKPGTTEPPAAVAPSKDRPNLPHPDSAGAKPERGERPPRPETPATPARPDRAERPEAPTPGTRSERAPRPEAAERPAHPEATTPKTERPEARPKVPADPERSRPEGAAAPAKPDTAPGRGPAKKTKETPEGTAPERLQ